MAAAGRAHRRLSACLAARPHVIVGVAPDHLLLDREPLGEDAAALASLAGLLHGLDVAAIELRAGLTLDELQRFASLASESRRRGQEDTGLRERLESEGLRNLCVASIDYRGLNFTERLGPRDEDDETVDVWDHLVATITDPGSFRTGLSPEDVALQVERQIDMDEGVGVGGLRRRVHAMTRRLEALSERDREGLRARLARFVGGLSGSLRSDLLRVEASTPDDSLALVAELAENLPDPVLLEVLRTVDARGDRVPPHLFTLLNKLIRVSSEQATVAQGLQDVLGRWGVSAEVALGADPAGLHVALEEVFQSRQEVRCNPEAYQGLLEHLSSRELETVTRAVFSRYRDPRDPVAVQVQVAEIALRLLEEEREETGQAGLLGYLGAATDTLLEAGQYAPVRDAAVAARNLCSRRDAGEESRLAAEGLLRDLTSERRIDRILEGIARGESLPRAAAALLALGGATSLARILDMLAGGPSLEVTEALRQLGTRMGSDPLAEVLRSRIDKGWPGIEPAIPLIRGMEPRSAVSLFELLTRHPDARVRQEGFAGLFEFDRRPGYPEGHLRRALEDRSSRVVAAAIQLLFSLGRGEAIDLLGTYLEGGLRGPESGPALARHVARGLCALGRPGRVRLCRALGGLRNSVRPRSVRVGQLIRTVLQPHAGNPEVDRALRRWRFSPAGVLALTRSRRAKPRDESDE
jgi:hypothetical protein